MAASSRSVLDLLFQQHSEEPQAGILRLRLQPDLTVPLQALAHPFFHCASTGNTPLCIHLSQQLGAQAPVHLQPLLLASVAGRGVNGDTPWRKSLMAAPSDVALMAGYSSTASVLELLQQGVPLPAAWTPKNHHLFPPHFREVVRQVLHGLCGSGWFLGLPGPARHALIHTLVPELCREQVWGSVSAEDWKAVQRGDWGTELNSDVAQLLARAAKQQQQQGAGTPSTQSLPSWQMRLHRRRAAKAGWLGVLVKGVMPVAMWVMVAQCRQRAQTVNVLAAYLAGTATGLSLPALAILMSHLVGQL